MKIAETFLARVGEDGGARAKYQQNLTETKNQLLLVNCVHYEIEIILKLYVDGRVVNEVLFMHAGLDPERRAQGSAYAQLHCWNLLIQAL